MRRGYNCKALIFMAFVLCMFLTQSKTTKGVEFTDTFGNGSKVLTLATGSPGILGLVKAMAEPFSRVNKCRIKWIKKGSGASLKLLKAGVVDLVMVHAPMAEKEAVAQGWAMDRTILGGNEFYIVGPGSDPAGVAAAASAKQAYKLIAEKKVKFFSRGDNSGTNKKEMKIWKAAGIVPGGSWYIVTKDFMGPTLMRADREHGYFMTDSSTFVVRKNKIRNLKVLFDHDPVLINVYHALIASPEKYPHTHHMLAEKFVKFMVSPEGQIIMKNFGKQKYGFPLYWDAEYAQKWEK